jgi:hypothetical protein
MAAPPRNFAARSACAEAAARFTKDFDSLAGAAALYCAYADLPANVWRIGAAIMSETTCAACDCKIEGEAIKVNVGGKPVEVCCEECATTLREAQAVSANL